MQIYDYEGNPRDEQWLEDHWGVTVEPPPDLREGERYFKCRVIRIGEGPCAILNNVRDEDPGPIVGQEVAFWWPDAPYPPESGHPPYTTNIYPHDWHDNFVFGVTNEEGNWAAAMGSGAMRNEGDPGPHDLWIHHEFARSDVARGLNWRTGTPHRAPILHWYLVLGTEIPPDPLPPPPDPDAFQKILDKLDLLLIGVQSAREKLDILRELLEGQPPPEPPPTEPELFDVQFFDNTELYGDPVHTTKEAPPLVHDWGRGSPAPGHVGENDVSARWAGSFTFESGVYIFDVITDDGARLWVDEMLLIDKWFVQAAHPYSASVNLDAGKHTVRLEWFEAAGDAEICLNWRKL